MTTAVNIAPLALQQFSQNGVPLAGGKLFTYGAGGVTKQATYTDYTGSTPNTNPIILDANGQCSLWLVPTLGYKFTLSPSTDTDPPTNAFWTEDGINLNAVTSSIGSSLVGYTALGTGAVATTVAAKLEERFSTKDYGVVGNGITDDTAAFNKARAAAVAANSTLYIYGTPLISSQLTVSGEHWVFDGQLGSNLTGVPNSYLIKAASLQVDLVVISSWKTIIEGGGIYGQIGNAGNGYTVNGSGCFLINPWVVQCGQDGIAFTGTASTGNFLKIEKPICFNNGRYGLYLNSNTYYNSNASVITLPLCQNNGSDGIRIDNAWFNTIIGPVCQSNTGYGIRMTAGAVNNTIIGGDVNEGNTAGQVIIDANAQNNNIFGLNYTAITDNGKDTFILGGTLSSLSLGGYFNGQSTGTLRVKSTYAATQAVALWNSDATATNRYMQYFGVGTSFAASGAIVVDGIGRLGLTNTAGDGLFIDSSGNSVNTKYARSQSKTITSTNGLTTYSATTQYNYLTGTAGASFAITLPAAASTIDGLKITIMSTANRASTTWVSSGASFVGAPSSLVTNTPVTLQYDNATTAWYTTQ